MEGHITISNIAKTLGVSAATVHRALHGKPGVSPAVAAEVCRLAKELGYRNVPSSALRKKAFTIAAAFPEATESNRYFYSQLWLGFHSCMEELKAYHINLLEFTYGDGPENSFPAQLRCLLKETDGKIDGLITGGRIFKEGFAMLRRLSASGVPVVLVTEDDPEGDYLCCVQPDFGVDGQMAAEFLSGQLGQSEKILMCAGDIKLHSNRSCMLGFEQYLNRLPAPRRLIKVYGYPEDPQLRERIRSLLTGDPAIGALYSVNLRCSLLLAQMVKELGLEGRIRLTGSDLCPESALYLKKGVLNAILFRDPALQARQGTKRLTDFLLHSIKPPSKSEIIRSTLILKSNLEQYL